MMKEVLHLMLTVTMNSSDGETLCIILFVEWHCIFFFISMAFSNKTHVIF
jgi:hypothetical protein